MLLSHLFEQLRKVRHFENLPDQSVKEIVFAGQILHYEAQDVIFHQGDSHTGLYVLLQGRVVLYKLGFNGQQTQILVLHPVTMFNEVPVIDAGTTLVTAVAVEKTTTWTIDHKSYHMLLARHPEIGTGLLQVLAMRNRLLFSRYEDLLSLPVLSRIAKIVLAISVYGTKPVNRMQYKNPDLAAMAATTPEAVSRALKELDQMSAIHVERKVITILAVEILEELGQFESGLHVGGTYGY